MDITLKRFAAVACMLGMLLMAPAMYTAQGGPLIKWVDENGEVHYGDTVPVDQSQHERNVLSEQGVVVETVERAKTPGELAEEKHRADLRTEEERKQAEQDAKDHVLLATFSSEDDMVLARDGKIAAIDTIIRLTKNRIRRITEQLQDLAHEAAEIERSGQPVPDDLHNRIANGKAEITRHTQYIETQQEEQKAIRKRFADDMARFRYLRSHMSQTPVENAATMEEKPAAGPDVP